MRITSKQGEPWMREAIWVDGGDRAQSDWIASVVNLSKGYFAVQALAQNPEP